MQLGKETEILQEIAATTEAGTGLAFMSNFAVNFLLYGSANSLWSLINS